MNFVAAKLPTYNKVDKLCVIGNFGFETVSRNILNFLVYMPHRKFQIIEKILILRKKFCGPLFFEYWEITKCTQLQHVNDTKDRKGPINFSHFNRLIS